MPSLRKLCAGESEGDMRCNFCDGSGMRQQGGVILPCPECGGCGVAHCCDGIQACCEVEGDMRLEREGLDAPVMASEAKQSSPA